MDAEGMVGRRHPSTSKEAAARPKFKTQRYRVLSTLMVLGPSTCAEVADRLPPLTRNQCATRLKELRGGGYVAYFFNEDGEIEERPTGPRTHGQVQVITPIGKAILWEEKEISEWGE